MSMQEIIADLEARHVADRPPVSDDLLEYVRAMEAQRDEARRDYAACAHAIGVEYEADGRASQPGPVADVVRYIEEAVRGSTDRLESEMRAKAAEKRVEAAERALAVWMKNYYHLVDEVCVRQLETVDALTKENAALRAEEAGK